MGFNKKHLLNESVLKLLKTGGLDSVREWLKKADSVIAESGVSSEVLDLLEGENLTPEKIQDKVKKIIDKGRDLN